MRLGKYYFGCPQFYGNERDRRIFLWAPKRLNRQWRWLEYAVVTEWSHWDARHGPYPAADQIIWTAYRWVDTRPDFCKTKIFPEF